MYIVRRRLITNQYSFAFFKVSAKKPFRKLIYQVNTTPHKILLKHRFKFILKFVIICYEISKRKIKCIIKEIDQYIKSTIIRIGGLFSGPALPAKYTLPLNSRRDMNTWAVKQIYT